MNFIFRTIFFYLIFVWNTSLIAQNVKFSFEQLEPRFFNNIRNVDYFNGKYYILKSNDSIYSYQVSKNRIPETYHKRISVKNFDPKNCFLYKNKMLRNSVLKGIGVVSLDNPNAQEKTRFVDTTITSIKTSETTIYLTSEFGLYYSEDRGERWKHFGILKNQNQNTTNSDFVNSKAVYIPFCAVVELESGIYMFSSRGEIFVTKDHFKTHQLIYNFGHALLTGNIALIDSNFALVSGTDLTKLTKIHLKSGKVVKAIEFPVLANSNQWFYVFDGQILIQSNAENMVYAFNSEKDIFEPYFQDSTSKAYFTTLNKKPCCYREGKVYWLKK